jgi:patatin-like phospholipase/acyl hydrolase
MNTCIVDREQGNFRILSIDGGGVRGIIPARILQAIEEISGKPIYNLFDLIVGTSTGGLIALALACPDANNQARYSAKNILHSYMQCAPEIFKHSFLHTLYTGAGLWGAKYMRKPYDDVLYQLFGDALLSQALCPVVTPTYSLIKGIPSLFCSRVAIENKIDYFMHDIAGATSAAPTYFPPKMFQDSLRNKHIEIDGGIFANNPETIGVAEAYSLYPNLKRDSIRLLSIGTGSPKLTEASYKLTNAGVIGWVMKANLIDIMIDADSNWYNEEISTLYPTSHRIQLPLPAMLGQMDNASTNNLSALLNLAEDFIEHNSDRLKTITSEICQM